MGTDLAEQRRISLHPPEGKWKPAVALPHAAYGQEPDTARETCADAQCECAVIARCDSAQQLLRLRQRFADFIGVRAAALCALRPTTTFATNDRRDLLNNLVGLKFQRQIFWNRNNQRDTPICHASKKNWAIKFCLESVRHRAQQLTIGIRDLRHA